MSGIVFYRLRLEIQGFLIKEEKLLAGIFKG